MRSGPPGVTALLRPTLMIHLTIGAGQLILRQGPAGSLLLRGGNEVSIYSIILQWCELGQQALFSMTKVLAGPNGCYTVIKLLISLSLLTLPLNVITAQFYKVFQTLGQMGKIWINEREHFRQWNYMGAVSRLPIASPRHKPLETCHVH